MRSFNVFLALSMICEKCRGLTSRYSSLCHYVVYPLCGTEVSK
jgi:hypothetical protein